MRAALDWSWDLLLALERKVLEQIAVFRTPFSIEAAEAIVSIDDDARVLDALESLKQRSLVFTHDEGRRLTFDLYDSIREYAGEKLDASGTRPDASLRHAHYFVERFEKRGPEVSTTPPRELEDLLAAARFCLSNNHRDVGRRAALAASPWLQGRPSTLRQLQDLALSQIDDSDAVIARLLLSRADFLRMRGETDGAEQNANRALAIAKSLGERSIEGQALALLGLELHGKGNFDGAEDHYKRALAIARAIGDKRLEAHTLGNWALTERMRRHVGEALELAEKALALHRKHNDMRHATSMLTVLGTLHHFRSQIDRSRRCYEEALEMARKTGDTAREAVVFGNLGNLNRMQAISKVRGRISSARAIFFTSSV
jgi:tetratricopeptide (TPR) repeat protein